jgi:5,10-methylenetetrahydromethanopterin reductase
MIDIGCVLCWGDSTEAFHEQVDIAEANGYGLIGVGDTPFAWHECYVGLALVVLRTQRAAIGPMVTTPMLRHPVAAAQSISTIQHLSGGRAILGYGSGANIPLGLGRKPATVEEMRGHILAVKALLNGESIEYDGAQVASLSNVSPVPIFISAYGPKVMQLAAEVADGVILETGADISLLAERVAKIRAAAVDVGRDPDEITIWARTFIAIRETHEEAIAGIAAHLTTAAAFWLRPRSRFAAVPEHLKDAVRRVQDRYDAGDHVVVGGHNAELLLQQQELTDYLAGITAIAGTPDEVSDSIRRVAALGVQRLISPFAGNADAPGDIRRFAEARNAAGSTGARTRNVVGLD